MVARRTCACALSVGSAAIDGAGTAIVGWRRDDGEGVGGGGASALEPGGDAWRPAPVSPGRTAAAPAAAGGAPRGPGGLGRERPRRGRPGRRPRDGRGLGFARSGCFA